VLNVPLYTVFLYLSFDRLFNHESRIIHSHQMFFMKFPQFRRRNCKH